MLSWQVDIFISQIFFLLFCGFIFCFLLDFTLKRLVVKQLNWQNVEATGGNEIYWLLGIRESNFCWNKVYYYDVKEYFLVIKIYSLVEFCWVLSQISQFIAKTTHFTIQFCVSKYFGKISTKFCETINAYCQ